MKNIGINIGSSSLKIVVTENNQVVWSGVQPHDGDFLKTLRDLLESSPASPGDPALITGTEGRYLFNIHNTIEPVCTEALLRYKEILADAVVSMGGEDLVVYTLDAAGKIQNNFSGSKCASGTGEFLKQQLGRMDMKLEDINSVSPDAKVMPLSSRCSVFMKSDCTHRLNKREATKDDIVVSLSNVMATKVIDFLKRAKITKGRVVLVGGVTRNKHILRFIQEQAPDIDFVVPEEAPYFEAYGASILAAELGSRLPSADELAKQNRIRFERYEPLEGYKDNVSYFSFDEGKVEAGKSYILGVDGGSTTTKTCLIDMETDTIVASHYGRTHGDPVKALKLCIAEMKKKIQNDIGDGSISIPLAATTGSSREILGVFLETAGIYNEIIAHSVGTTYFAPDVDTIFEIGGQDAKYVLLKNRVPIDYAMNEACSAGTGSFLEESAQGDLNIGSAPQIGPIAMNAKAPLKFGEHCSAFINSDIRKAIQQGASREDITAGIVTSIVSNYLNRVVGNRTIGSRIFLQGGVAKNPAVPLAFAMLLKKEILVPPAPELMGCFGVGVLAKQKMKDGLLDAGSYDLDAIMEQEIVYEREFNCKSCDNLCPIKVLNVNGHKYMFGGRCNKYANTRKKVSANENVTDWVEARTKLMFEDFAPDPDTRTTLRPEIIGIPKAFSVHSLYPLYAWFFHELGFETRLTEEIDHEGVARVESTYCFPAEIAHGAVQDAINTGADYILVPHFRDMESYEDDVHANFCPITQSLPYYIKKAFPQVRPKTFIPLIVTFKFGEAKALEFFTDAAKALGSSEDQIARAFHTALAKQKEYTQTAAAMGRTAYEQAKAGNQPVIALLGRPYNAFTKDANMGIPRKFTTRGYSIIPYDMLPFTGDEKIFPNMYWYYGQQNMKATALIKNDPNLFITYITNFSCAPDSFMLHYIKWQMGTKPFLILELDSHSADAGIDTRVEAFLDIIDGYRTKLDSLKEDRYDNGLEFVNTADERIHIRNNHTGEEIPVKHNKRVKLLLSNMGEIGTELVAAVMRSNGINAEAMPVANRQTLEYARSHASGKECVPSHLVLGSALQYFSGPKYRKDEIYLLFVPITTGPCRTGQYFVFYENLFRDLKLENVVVFTLSADNSYTELGADFSKHAWWGLAVSDYMKDLHTALRTCAKDPEKALAVYRSHYRSLIDQAEKDITGVIPHLRNIAKDLRTLPLRRSLKSCPKILIVGEIYVRRDDFAVDELIEHFSSKGIIGKVSGIGEWIHYLDFVRKYDLKKRLKLKPLVVRPFSKEFRRLCYVHLESWWKHRVEGKIKKALGMSNLLPSAPHDMNKIMNYTSTCFVNHELNSEIAVSSGVAAASRDAGFSGVVNISPFACLIGRVIEGIFTPWARDHNYPVMSVEVDGNLLPPNIISKLNIFMLNVLRYKADPGMAPLIEKAAVPDTDNDGVPERDDELIEV
ncbi:MAG: activase [Spirochaetales bacterium]|nr:activase [Spirochaetales bacterium]